MCVCVGGICLCVQMCVGVDVYDSRPEVHIIVFLYLCPLYFLKQDLSLDLELWLDWLDIEPQDLLVLAPSVGVRDGHYCS